MIVPVDASGATDDPPAPDPLRRWTAALATGTEPTALVLGDSIAEGLDADTLDQRWINLVQDDLRSRFPRSGGGIGYLASFHAFGLFRGPPVAGAVTRTRQRGLGYRGLQIDDGGTVTYDDVVGTTARVWFASVKFASPLAVSVDGQAPIIVPTASDSASYQDTWTEIPLGASGPHDVVVSRGPGGTYRPNFGGLQVLDGGASVQIVDAAQAGTMASDYALGATGGSALVSDLAGWVTETDASLAVLALGLNEWQKSVPPDSYRADMQTLIDELRSVDPDLPVMLIAWYQPMSTYAGDFPWTDYVDEMRLLAAANPDVLLVDEFSDPERWPQPTSLSNDGFYRDGLHPTSVGATAIADVLADVLASGRAGPQPDARIRRGAGRLVGDDRYNTTGARQTRHGIASPGQQIVYFASIQNDGPGTAQLRVRAGPSTAQFELRYRHGHTDVTDQVTAGTFLTPALEPGGAFRIEIAVTPSRQAPSNTSIRRALTVTSPVDDLRDVVATVTTTR